MNIIECHFEFGGFDDDLVRGGISVYLWNLCRKLRAGGHSVMGLTASHGLLPLLADRYEVEDLGWRDHAEIPVRLDPLVWPRFPAQVAIPVSVTGHRLRVGGMDVVVLAGGPLDQHTEAFYPPYELKGRDLSFLKPLVFQVMASRFLRATAPAGAIVHIHEPYYHYLVPAALQDRGLVVVSTVQSNMPVGKKAYGPEVRTLLEYLGADPAAADGLSDPPLDAPGQRVARALLPSTLLYNDYPERPGHDYVSILGLVLRTAHALDFLSPGQLEHVVTQADTPFEQLFEDLAVCRELRAGRSRLVVGGCAIGDTWLDVSRSNERRQGTLGGLGLDPALPTVYHNARYAPNHKGQHEMLRALRRLLDGGERANVLLHCLAPQPPDDPDLRALAEEHITLVRVRTDAMREGELIGWAAASDLCLFPSKFEMDTFLMAMGEAMACGSVPIATAQRGIAHFGQAFDLDDPSATGLALPRSFRIDDPLLVDAIEAGLREMLRLVRHEPERIEALRARGVAVARQFTWDRVADRFLAIFAACAADALPPPEPAALLARGWADLLTDRQLAEAGNLAIATARRRGDVGLLHRLRPHVAARLPELIDLFAAARTRVNVDACERIAACSGDPEMVRALRERASARREGDALHVRWAFAPAARVEAVVAPGAGGPPDVVTLAATADGSFAGRVPTADLDQLAFLITLPDGRAVWDRVPAADGQGPAGA